MRMQIRPIEDEKHPGSYFMPKDSVPIVEMRERPMGGYENYVGGRRDDFTPAGSERSVTTRRGDTLYLNPIYK